MLHRPCLLRLVALVGHREHVGGQSPPVHPRCRRSLPVFARPFSEAHDQISVLGYSKRIAERLTAAVAETEPGAYVSVRFGLGWKLAVLVEPRSCCRSLPRLVGQRSDSSASRAGTAPTGNVGRTGTAVRDTPHKPTHPGTPERRHGNDPHRRGSVGPGDRTSSRSPSARYGCG
jgi:hypothetical protein